MPNDIYSNNPIIATSAESSVEASEEQKKFKRFKKKFIRYVQKSPEFKHMNPEDLWDAIDKTQLFNVLPYQKVKERR